MEGLGGDPILKVAVIIPAYNEEQNIARVLRVVAPMRIVHEVVVVSDGSEDRTASVARRFRTKVVELPTNVGKGGAMVAGVRNTGADVLLFLDADLVGLRRSHIQAMLRPVLDGQADMTLGVFEEGRLATDLAQRLAPFLSGQRACRRELLDRVPELETSGFGVELALSRFCDKHDVRVERVVLPRLAQVIKEEKAGFWKGFAARMRMYWEILKSYR